MEIKLQLKSAIRHFDNIVYTNRIYLPLATMMATTTFFAVTQDYSLLFSGSVVISTGLATFTGVKIAEMYVKLNKVLEKLNKETLPVTNQSLEELAKILPEIDAILYGIMNPASVLQNKVHDKLEDIGEALTTKASTFVGGFLHLMHLHKAESRSEKKQKKAANEESVHHSEPSFKERKLKENKKAVSVSASVPTKLKMGSKKGNDSD